MEKTKKLQLEDFTENEFFGTQEQQYLKENLQEAPVITGQNHYIYVNSKGQMNIIYLIQSKRNFFGYIIMQVDDQSEMERQLAVAENIALACSLIFNKKSKVSEISDFQREEYLVNLIVWNFQSMEMALKGGRSLGYDITKKETVVVININAFNVIQYEAEKKALTSYIKRWILPSINDKVKQQNEANIASFRSDTILLFLAPNERRSKSVLELCNAILKLFRETDRTSVSIGISDAMQTITDIPEAYNQAFQAAIIGRQLYGENRIITFEEIFYVYQIKKLGKQQKTLDFCRRLLSPIMEYDKAKGTDMMETFEKLILFSSDAGATAEALFIHRNTLLYRKNRIMEILGVNPFEMPYLFNYTIAFLILNSTEL